MSGSHSTRHPSMACSWPAATCSSQIDVSIPRRGEWSRACRGALRGSCRTDWLSLRPHSNVACRLTDCIAFTMNLLNRAAQRMAPSVSRGTPVVYFLRLLSGSLYIGASTDLAQRLDDHFAGHACETTRFDRAKAVLRVEVFGTFVEARARETQLKRWARAKKEALISGDFERLRSLSRSKEVHRNEGGP